MGRDALARVPALSSSAASAVPGTRSAWPRGCRGRSFGFLPDLRPARPAQGVTAPAVARTCGAAAQSQARETRLRKQPTGGTHFDAVQARGSALYPWRAQHRFHFLPLPQGHGLLRSVPIGALVGFGGGYSWVVPRVSRTCIRMPDSC